MHFCVAASGVAARILAHACSSFECSTISNASLRSMIRKMGGGTCVPFCLRPRVSAGCELGKRIFVESTELAEEGGPVSGPACRLERPGGRFIASCRGHSRAYHGLAPRKRGLSRCCCQKQLSGGSHPSTEEFSTAILDGSVPLVAQRGAVGRVHGAAGECLGRGGHGPREQAGGAIALGVGCQVCGRDGVQVR